MLNGSAILVSAFWRAILYLITVLLLLYMNLRAPETSALLHNFVSVISQLLLILIFVSLITILKKINERRIIIISFIFYPVILLFTLANSLIFHNVLTSLPTVILATFNVITVINLFIQVFRIKRSYISVYYRLIVITIFAIFTIKLIVPLLAVLFNHLNNGAHLEGLTRMIPVLSECLYIIIPVGIILMIKKIKFISSATNS